MPKFYGQNKKRIDPRYFLNETTDRDFIEEEYGEEPADPGPQQPQQDLVAHAHSMLYEALEALYEINNAIEKEGFTFNRDSPITLADLLSKAESIGDLLNIFHGR